MVVRFVSVLNSLKVHRSNDENLNDLLIPASNKKADRLREVPSFS